jgi:hypothetical protein
MDTAEGPDIMLKRIRLHQEAGEVQIRSTLSICRNRDDPTYQTPAWRGIRSDRVHHLSYSTVSSVFASI